jgi:hypothetical protein
LLLARVGRRGGLRVGHESLGLHVRCLHC